MPHIDTTQPPLEEIHDIAFENSPNRWVSEKMVFIPPSSKKIWQVDVHPQTENKTSRFYSPEHEKGLIKPWMK